MVSRNHGRIINVCSVAGFLAGSGALPYFSSKFGVEGYSEALRIELDVFQLDGIHVTTVYPWFVKTPLIGTLEIAKESPHFGQEDPLGRALINTLPEFMEPEYVGREIVEGTRREYEYIYLPRSISRVLLLNYFFPMKFRKLCHSIHFNLLQHKDPEQQKNFSMTYCQVVSNGNDKWSGRDSNSA